MLVIECYLSNRFRDSFLVLKKIRLENLKSQQYSFSFFLVFSTISIRKRDWIEAFLNQSRDDVLFSWWRKTRLGERVVVRPNCTKASVPNGGESRLRVSNHDWGRVSGWNESVCLKQKAFVRAPPPFSVTHTRTHTISTRHHHPLCAKTSPFCRPIQKELVALSFRVKKRKKERKRGRKKNSIFIIYLCKNIDI